MLLVEDGSGLAAAQAYADVNTCDAYHELRGNSSWASASEEEKEAAVLRAMAVLDARRWIGRRATAGQALQWPRVEAVDRDGYEMASNFVPQAVISALCEMALIEVASPGALAPSLDRGGAVAREKVGEIEVEYAPGASPATRHTVVDALLYGLASGRSSFEIGRG